MSSTPKPSEWLAEWRELEAKGEVIIQPAEEGDDEGLLVVGRDFVAIVTYDPFMVSFFEERPSDLGPPEPVTDFVLDRFQANG